MRGRPQSFKLHLKADEAAQLEKEAAGNSMRRACRAQILLYCSLGLSQKEVADKLKLSTGRIRRTLEKYRQGGIAAALSDLSRSGRPVRFCEADRTTVKLIACQKPFTVPDGPQASLWTIKTLTSYLKGHAAALGHPALENIGEAAVEKILERTELAVRLIAPNPPSSSPLGSALLYKRLEFLCAPEEQPEGTVLRLSNGDYGRILDPGSYKIVSLMLGIDLFSGRIYGLLTREHNPHTFVEFLALIDKHYAGKTLNFILDKHPVHTAPAVSSFLAKSQTAVSFVYEPQAIFVLDAIEKLLSKFIRLDLEKLAAPSFHLLQIKVQEYFDKVNLSPAASRWHLEPADIRPFVKSFT